MILTRYSTELRTFLECIQRSIEAHWFTIPLIIRPSSSRVNMLGIETEYHHHQVLLLLVEHRASMKSFQTLRSPAISLTSIHDLPVRHVLIGLPLFLYPWGFQSNAVFSIAPTSFRNVCPFYFRFLNKDKLNSIYVYRHNTTNSW